MDPVTLITRPRRFGKTLTMSMVEQFLSVNYAGRSDLFENLSIWNEEKYRKLQGTFPVINLSFANIKEKDYPSTRYKICQMLVNLYSRYYFLKNSEYLTEMDKKYFDRISVDMNDGDATLALYQLTDFLHRYYGKKVVILLDEYDTPMQEAYVEGFWPELVTFTRGMFNAAFKTNPWLERAILTGITRVSRESIFSDLNNLEVVTTTSNKYADCFGFTEEEVFASMDECGRLDKEMVKKWYDGFTFGDKKDIYNPWSIINYLDKGQFTTYWANTSSNSLVGKLIRQGTPEIKSTMEDLLNGKTLRTQIDEQIVFNQLDHRLSAIWSLLLASGYLKVVSYQLDPNKGKPEYELELTNMEVRLMFEEMIEGWFSDYTPAYNQFFKALLLSDVKAMNHYMNRVALETFSCFREGNEPSDCLQAFGDCPRANSLAVGLDVGNKPSEYAEPERFHSAKAITMGLTEPNPSACFYHGFVLGLLVEMRDRYAVISNRESGFGRYDVILEPIDQKDPAYILEFKVHDPQDEETLADTVSSALAQIEEKGYAAALLANGITADRIRKYGFAFEGKKVMIG